MQLNALNRLRAYIGNKEMEILINSFIYSNFSYCPLVWHFSSCKSTAKIEKIQKRCLRMILNDNTSDDDDDDDDDDDELILWYG